MTEKDISELKLHLGTNLQKDESGNTLRYFDLVINQKNIMLKRKKNYEFVILGTIITFFAALNSSGISINVFGINISVNNSITLVLPLIFSLYHIRYVITGIKIFELNTVLNIYASNLLPIDLKSNYLDHIQDFYSLHLAQKILLSIKRKWLRLIIKVFLFVVKSIFILGPFIFLSISFYYGLNTNSDIQALSILSNTIATVVVIFSFIIAFKKTDLELRDNKKDN